MSIMNVASCKSKLRFLAKLRATEQKKGQFVINTSQIQKKTYQENYSTYNFKYLLLNVKITPPGQRGQKCRSLMQEFTPAVNI